MLLHRRIVLCGRSIGALALFALGSSACRDDSVVVTHSDSGSGSGVTSDTSGTIGTPKTGSVTTGHRAHGTVRWRSFMAQFLASSPAGDRRCGVGASRGEHRGRPVDGV